ncbi:AAA family ATPase [Kribbella sp. NPDC050241]|uniref:helix-turn-helix transcriptional regulator n=1 Tax=Kribbella sp. NPDC050241 TaxID=3364115 RepID=UPI0037B190F7
MLYGRQPERQRIEHLVGNLTDGNPGLLVIRGEAGAGKSVLLDHAASCAGDAVQVLRGYGVQGEAELPFAALHQLLRPLLDRMDDLPGPQAAALRSAFGLMPSEQVDRMLVGLGTLTLLSEAADERPLLCLVDDAHWLDKPSADTLWFVAGRLVAERIGLIFAARDEQPIQFPAAPEVRLTGLDTAAAAALLTESHPDLTGDVVRRVIDETSANPLALIELPAALSAAQRAGVEPLPGPLPLPERLQKIYQVQLENLPAATRAILLLSAAEESSDLAVVLRAAGARGLDVACLHPAEAAGLVRTEDSVSGRRIVFRHPLLRAAAYRSASLSERIEAHRCLAQVLDPELDADRRAWHLAASATGPDDRIAAALDHCGERALQRGGPATAATAFEKAAWLTAAPSERARRLSAAAQAANLAGHPARAERLVEQSDRMSTDLVVQAHNRRLRASMAFDRGSPVSTHQLLLAEIDKVATADSELAALMLFDAVKNAWFANDRDWSRQAIHALRALVLPPDSPHRSAVRVVLDLSDRLEVLTDGQPLGLPAAYDEGAADQNRSPVELVLQAAADLSLADDDAALAAAETAVRACRTGGQVGLLVLSLQILATVEMLTGRYRYALANATEGLELSTVLGQQNRACHFEAVLAWLEAVAGKEESCRRLATSALGHAEVHRVTPVVAIGRWALCLLDLGIGHPDSALEQPTFRDAGTSEHPLVSVLQTPDLIEAAARTGRPDEVRDRLAKLSAWATDSGRPAARAVDLRCRALVANDEKTAGDLYRAALDLHDEASRAGQPRPFDRARTQLLYGEWLRRQRRRTEARVPLRAAADTFDQLGASPWSERAGNELRAAGDTSRTTQPAPLADLTPQELQVIRLAREGASNREIGAQLFLSPRTVAYHLQKVFRKLSIRSRVELAQLSFTEPPDKPPGLA